MKSWIISCCLALAHLPALAASCGVSALNVPFGDYNPFSYVDVDTTGSITINCQSALTETVSLSVAMTAGVSGSFTSRQMRNTSGGSAMRYNLYGNASRTTVWGDGTGGSSTVSASMLLARCLACPPENPNSASVSLPVYARAFSRQNLLPAGAYLDTITVIVTF